METLPASETTGEGELSALLRAVAEAPAIRPGYRRPHLLQGRTVGRFRIEGEIGSGGMGVVYRAHHIDLDRIVALKIHFVRGSARERHRLLREARWMARLAHPNVVTIHDVGTIDDQVFIAMEYVDGGTLRGWLRTRTRRWREILDVFVAAGRGLAAAHAAGLVHRDFKPDNVLLGRDPRRGDGVGRVRVADFGLAQEDVSEPERGTDPDKAAEHASAPSSRLTRTGAVAGTPAYMAPEQHGGHATPRSDQFAFCVALHEAVYGVRPYAGDNVGELLTRIAEHRVEIPADGPRVPRFLQRALRRGLDPDPNARFDSMADLLAILSRRSRPASRRAAPVLLGSFALFGIAGALYLPRVQEVCDGDPLAGIWDARERSALAERFATAPEAWAELERALDARADSLGALAAELCRSSRIAADDVADRDRQRACVDAERRRLRGVLEVVATGDAEVLEHVDDLVGDLPSVDACRDLERLRDRPDAPTDPIALQRAADIDAALTKVVALDHASRYDEARTLAEATVDEARDLGDARTEAAALYQLGSLLLRQTDLEAAASVLEEAYYRAAAGNDDGGMADAAIALARAHGQAWGHHEVGLAWLRRAEVALERVGDDSRYRVDFEAAAGTIHETHGDLVEAEAHYRRALEAVESGGGGERRQLRLRGVAWAGLGRALDGQGRKLEAIEAYRESTELFAAGTNPEHPSVAANLNNLAAALYDLERYEEAIEHYERAIAIVGASLGPDSGIRGTFLGNLANAYTALGRHDEAIAKLDVALQILEREYGRDHVEVAAAIGNIARIERKRGNLDRSCELFERAIASLEADVGADHPDLADTLLGYAATLRAKGDTEAALRQARRAVQVASADKRPLLARAHLDIGMSLLALGNGAEAVEAIERSLAIGFGDGDAHVWARANFALARAVVLDDPAQREKAIALASTARELLGDASDDDDDAASLDAWLAENGV